MILNGTLLNNGQNPKNLQLDLFGISSADNLEIKIGVHLRPMETFAMDRLALEKRQGKFSRKRSRNNDENPH